MQILNATPSFPWDMYVQLLEAAAVCQAQIDIMGDAGRGLTMHISKECTCACRFSQDSFST